VELNKGLLGANVTVRMLGGRADGFTSRVDGVPAFRAGEEVYLFLWGKPGEAYRVLGWSAGNIPDYSRRPNGYRKDYAGVFFCEF